jgi:hypothetical protein
MTGVRSILPLLLLLSGCSLLGGLHVETLGSGAQRPGNVAAYVAVSDGDDPVTELDESNFTVYENEQLVPSDQTRARLLDRDLGGVFRTLLVIDLGFAARPDARRELENAVNGFVEKVRATQAVSVFGFDGGPQLKLLAEFSKGEGAGVEAFRLPNMPAADRSRNLNGAVKRALTELDTRLAQGRKPVRVGTLVVFANGPDLAGRISERELDDTLDEQRPVLVSIGVGEHAPASLQALGRDGFFAAQSESAVAIAFEEAAYSVRRQYEKHYLFSYCSPSRAGARRLRLEVHFSDKKANEKKGNAEAEFDAKGYGSGCDPVNLPPIKPAQQSQKERSTSSPRAGSASDEALEKSKHRTTPESDSAPALDGDEGVVVPPPKRPGYAP